MNENILEEYQNLCLNAEMNDPSFAINIYVTSAPTDATSQFENTCDPETWGRPIRRSSVNSYSSDRKRVDMKYTNSDLYFLCRSNSSGQLGNIKVWKSRPVVFIIFLFERKILVGRCCSRYWEQTSST